LVIPIVQKYVPQFDPSFNALVGTQAELKPLLAGLRVYAAKVKGSSPDEYLMDHTASSYVFDKQGRVRLLVRHNGDVDPLVNDVEQLLDGK
jgi:protein SCO1/2